MPRATAIGLLAGVLAGGAAGFVTGSVCGAANQFVADGADYEELFVGFGEYSMRGMAFFSMLACGGIAAVGGPVSGMLGVWTKSRTIGALGGGVIGLILSLCLIYISAQSLDDIFTRQVNVVWALGSVAGCCVGGAIGARPNVPPVRA